MRARRLALADIIGAPPRCGTNDGSGRDQRIDAAEQGRAWIARALVRLGHPGLIDPALDSGVLRAPPSSRLGRILERPRRFRDSLKYQGKAVGTLTAIYFVV